jgi:hypothetical protein
LDSKVSTFPPLASVRPRSDSPIIDNVALVGALVANGGTCTDSTQCLSRFCSSGICVEPSRVPALSGPLMAFLVAVLFLAGLLSLQRARVFRRN